MYINLAHSDFELLKQIFMFNNYRILSFSCLDKLHQNLFRVLKIE